MEQTSAAIRKKKDREERGELFDDLGIALKGDVAGVRLACEHEELRRLEVGKLGLGVGDLRLSVGNFGFKFREPVLVFAQAVLVLGAAVRERLHAVLIFGKAAPIRVDAAFKLGEGAVGRVELRLLLGLLAFEFLGAAVVLRPARVELGARGGKSASAASSSAPAASSSSFRPRALHRCGRAVLCRLQARRRSARARRASPQAALRFRRPFRAAACPSRLQIRRGPFRTAASPPCRHHSSYCRCRARRCTAPSRPPKTRRSRRKLRLAGVILGLAGLVRCLGLVELRTAFLQRLPPHGDGATELALAVVILPSPRLARFPTR